MALLIRPPTLPSNAQLTALLEGVDEVLVLLDARLRVSFCSRAAQRLLGCEPGQGAEAALAQLDDGARLRLLAQLQAPGQPAHGDAATPVPARLADGTRLRLSLSPLGGGARMLRSPLHSPPPPQPRLTPGATSELVRLLWDSAVPLTVQNARFLLVAANRAYFELLSLSPDDLLGTDPASLLSVDDRSALLAARAGLQAALAAGSHCAALPVHRLTDAQGRPRWFDAVPRWATADDGEPLLLAVLHECTLERLPAAAPASLAGNGDQPASSARHDDAVVGDQAEAAWFDLSPVGMLVFDANGLVLRSNPALTALVGPLPARLDELPADVAQLLAWSDGAPLPALQHGAAVLEQRVTVTLADGRRQRLRARLRALNALDAQPAVPAAAGAELQVLAVVDDRSLEEEQELAQLEIGALMDTAGMGVATYEASRGWLPGRPMRPASAGAGALIAAPAGPPGPPGPSSGLPGGLQAIGRDQVEPASRDEFERLQRALREGQRAQVRYAVQVPEMGTRWLLTRVEPGALTDGRAALSVVTLDITEQEEAHRRSEQLLRELSTILDGTTAGIAYLRGERLVRCNRRFEAMLGLPPGRAAGALIGDLLADQPEAQALLRRALGAEGRHETELQRAGVAPQWLALSASRAPVAPGGADAPELVVVLTDVSRLKAQQAELEALARERELMFTLSDVGVAYLRQGRIERANAALARLTGYSVDELAQLPLAALFEDEASFQLLSQQQRAALQSAGIWRGERWLRRRDGRLVWVQVSKRRVDEGGGQGGIISSYVDIDERRRARESVQLQAERTRAILDSVLVGIVTVGDGGIEWMNRSARRMFGGELADFVGEPIAIVATAEPDHPLRATHYLKNLADGQAETFECRLRGRDGREFWVVGNAVVTGRGEASAGSPAAAGHGGSQITFALLDIERRRQAEVSIAQAQASLQRIIETAPLAIALFDAATGRVLRLNQMAAMFFGRPVEAVLGRAPEAWFGAADAQSLRQDLDAALAQTEVLRRELPRPAPAHAAAGGDDDPHAEIRVWDMRIVSLDNASSAPGTDRQLLLVASDVTEQRAAEQARFEAAVSQREMLVKEVHHRIKNNLQGVAGLLQQTAVRRPEVADLIGEAVGQVQAIAQVHGLQVGVSGPLRIKPLVEAITASVQRTFGRAVIVQVEGTPPHRFALPEAESIPIALTINELLTNAIKHSTPGDIRCVLHCDEARLAISVFNPGQLREGFTLAQVPPGVSGLGLVRALLPRRTATLTLLQVGIEVEAKVVLVPPSITLLEPL